MFHELGYFSKKVNVMQFQAKHIMITECNCCFMIFKHYEVQLKVKIEIPLNWNGQDEITVFFQNGLTSESQTINHFYRVFQDC